MQLSTTSKSNSSFFTSPASPIDLADLFVHYLEQLGVEIVFGVPGGAIEPIYNAIARSSRRGGIQAVTACHEAGAAYMADGYARESGKLGVCIATSGPGATNMITGVACSYDNNIPVLAITGQPAITSFGRRALQESACTGVNVVGMFKHCTRYNSLVSHAEQFETKLTNAILSTHQGAMGPAHLSIPVDILRSPISQTHPKYNLVNKLTQQNNLIDQDAIDTFVREFDQAKNPIFLIGHGAAQSIESIMQLIQLKDALFVTTPDAKGLINPRHQNYRGVFGFGGHASAIKSLSDGTDLIIAIGTAFGEFASSGWSEQVLNHKLIHVDSSDENLMRTPMAKLHVKGNIQSTFKHINDSYSKIHPEAIFAQNTRILESEINPHIEVLDTEEFVSNSVPIKPQRLMRELSNRCPPDTRFVADAGNSMIWTPHYLQLQNRRGYRMGNENKPDRRKQSNWLRMTLDFAPMGWAIGAAIGVARANPKSPTVCITGDGSYLMSGQEISVAAREQLPVIIVVLNDSVYGMVMHGQRLAEAEPIAFDLPQTNFAQLVAAMGIPAHVINSPDDFDALNLDEILRRKGPTLIDVRIDREAVPPMRMRLETLGSAEATDVKKV